MIFVTTDSVASGLKAYCTKRPKEEKEEKDRHDAIHDSTFPYPIHLALPYQRAGDEAAITIIPRARLTILKGTDHFKINLTLVFLRLRLVQVKFDFPLDLSVCC